MNYTDFVCLVKDQVQEKMKGETVQINVRRVTKNNGVELEGLSITEEAERISPMIYLEEYYQFYKGGISVDEIVATILRNYRKAKEYAPADAEFYRDYDKVKDKIVCKLINYEKNRNLLPQIPHQQYLDLAIVFYYMLENREIGDGTILIYDSHLSMWGIDKEELYLAARKNSLNLMPHEFQSMAELLGHVGETAEGDLPMYVLTNEKKYLGAVNIIYDHILADIGSVLEDDFFVLPSSIHEVIIIPATVRATKGALKSMVREINATQVSPEEILSDEIYYYERSLHRLSL